MSVEYKTISFKVDGTSDEEGVFKGIGSGFGDIDQGGDIMQAGCFDECLSRKSPDMIKCLWQHNQKEPMGYYRKLIALESGLEVEGKIFPTTLGKDALILMKGDEQGTGVDGLSIGFVVEDFHYEQKDGQRIRVITKADLLEISVVTFPMHLRCRINGVKNMNVEAVNELKSLADIEGMLRDMGLTKNASTALISKVTEFKKLSDEGEPQTEQTTKDVSDSQTEEVKTESTEAHSRDEDAVELTSDLNQLIKSLESFKGDK